MEPLVPKPGRSSTSVGAGPLHRRNFLKAGAGVVVGGLLAWRLWPWRQAGGPPATSAGPAPEPAPPPAGLAAVDRLPTDRTRTWLGPRTGPTGSRTGGCTRAGWSAWPPPGRCGPAPWPSDHRAGRRRPAGRSGSAPAPWPPVTASPGSWSGPAGAGSTTGRPPWSRAPPARAAASSASTRPTAASASATTPTSAASSPTPPSTAPSTRPAPAPVPGRGRRAGPRARPPAPGPLPAAPGGQGAVRAAAGRGPPRRGGRGRRDRRDRARLLLGRPERRGAPLVRRARHRRGQVARRPERAEGPVLGTLYTLNGSVLKLTAQLFPVGDGDPRRSACRPRPRRRLGGPGGRPGRPRVRGRLPGDRLGRRRRAPLPGPVGGRDRRGRRSRARWPPTRRPTASYGSGCSTAPSTATGP